jgi:hypothetical protein
MQVHTRRVAQSEVRGTASPVETCPPINPDADPAEESQGTQTEHSKAEENTARRGQGSASEEQEEARLALRRTGQMSDLEE